MKNSFKFFNTLTDDEITHFLDYCETSQKNAGDILWEEGDTENYAAFVVSGKVGIKKRTEFEGRYMIVGTFSKGTVVGELCLFYDRPRSVTAVIIEPVELVLLSSNNFEQLMTQYPLIGLKLLKHIFMAISNRLNRSTSRIAKIF